MEQSITPGMQQEFMEHMQRLDETVDGLGQVLHETQLQHHGLMQSLHETQLQQIDKMQLQWRDRKPSFHEEKDEAKATVQEGSTSSPMTPRSNRSPQSPHSQPLSQPPTIQRRPNGPPRPAGGRRQHMRGCRRWARPALMGS